MKHGGGLRRGDMPQIGVNDVLELRGGDFTVIDWGYKPWSARLSEPAQYLLILRGEGNPACIYHVVYLDNQAWRRGEHLYPSVGVYDESGARKIFQEKAQRNNFAIQVR